MAPWSCPIDRGLHTKYRRHNTLDLNHGSAVQSRILLQRTNHTWAELNLLQRSQVIRLHPPQDRVSARDNTHQGNASLDRVPPHPWFTTTRDDSRTPGLLAQRPTSLEWQNKNDGSIDSMMWSTPLQSMVSTTR